MLDSWFNSVAFAVKPGGDYGVIVLNYASQGDAANAEQFGRITVPQ
jgi:hypothetical protein